MTRAISITAAVPEASSFAPGASLYQVDRNASTRLFDLFRLKRYYAMLEYQKIFSERTQLDISQLNGVSKRRKEQRVRLIRIPFLGPGRRENEQPRFRRKSHQKAQQIKRLGITPLNIIEDQCNRRGSGQERPQLPQYPFHHQRC